MKNNISRLSNLIVRKWNSVKGISDKIFKHSLLKIHALKSSLNTKKQEHIIICGPDIRGSSILCDMFIKCTSSKTNSIINNISALNSLNYFKKSIVTCESADLFSVNEIENLLNEFRNLKFIIVIKNPESLLTEVHNDIPWQYYQSWDFGFYTTPHPSFTRPGVGKAFDEIEKLKEADTNQIKIIRYEDFLENPDDIQAEISGFTDIKFKNSFSDYLSNTDKLHKNTSDLIHTDIEQTTVSNRDSNHADRIKTLYQLFPGIQDRMEEYGYFEDENVNRNTLDDLQPENGTVVGMYTPDDTYRNEAKRMMASLDRLGVQHSVDELPPVEKIALVDNPEAYPAWFVQKLARYYKPTWLKQKREQLRGPILYCDVDAFFHKDPWPYLSLYDGDMAVFSRRDGFLNSATIWINDTKNSLEILKLWEQGCQQKRKEIFDSWPNVLPSTSDQRILKQIVLDNINTKDFKIQRLPATMLYVFDHDYLSIGDVFIEQLQASRVAKSKASYRKMNNEPTARDRRIDELESILF